MPLIPSAPGDFKEQNSPTSYQIACVSQWGICRPIKQTVPRASSVWSAAQSNVILSSRPAPSLSQLLLEHRTILKTTISIFSKPFLQVRYWTLERKSLLQIWVILSVVEYFWYQNQCPSGEKWDKYFELHKLIPVHPLYLGGLNTRFSITVITDELKNVRYL